MDKRYYITSLALELGEEPKVGTAAKMFRDVIYHNKSRLLAGIICAGYDKHQGGQVRGIYA